MGAAGRRPLPGEDVDRCAERELDEETGLGCPFERTGFGDDRWVVYLSEAPDDAEVRLSEEHDRFLWAPAEAAVRMCLPALVSEPLMRAAAQLLQMLRG